MSASSLPTLNHLTQEQRRTLAELRNRFARAWAQSPKQPPRIEEFVVQIEPAGRAGLLMALVRIEIDYRRGRGETVTFAEFQRRFPAQPWLEALFQNLPQLTASQPLEQANVSNSGDGKAETVSYIADSPDSPTPPMAPLVENVPGYVILEALGRGGMGVVYKALHTKLNREVALKMIRAGSDAEASELTRFRIEAEAVARLQHPNIVQIFEIGEHQGNPFFSLEFCSGGTLASRIAKAPLPPREAAQIVETLAIAIDAAHRAKVLHRDLKPSNVLLTQDGQPKIADFGLAKKLDQESDQTRTGAVVGTPSYMAPEQARGEVHALTPQTDVYALGAILYACLCGRAPFRGSTSWETLRLVIENEPTPLRSAQSALSLDLETICLKCLAKNPADRYESASALAEELRRFLEGNPILARPVSRPERLWRWCKRNPTVASLAVTVLFVLVLGTVLSLSFALEASDKSRAEQEANKGRKAASVRADRERQEKERKKERKEYEAYAKDLLEVYQQWRQGDPLVARALLEKTSPQLRHFEYDYLDSLVNPKPTYRLDSANHVVGVVCSADASRLVGICRKDTNNKTVSPTIKIWKAKTGEELHAFRGHARTTSMSLSRDGQLFATGSEDHFVRIWDLPSGRSVRTFRQLGSRVTSLAFSAEGDHLAIGTNGGRITVWNVQTGNMQILLQKSGNVVTALAYSPNGEWMVSGGGSSTGNWLNVWNAKTGEQKHRFSGHRGAIHSAEFSRDSKRIVSAGGGGTSRPRFTTFADLRVWDVEQGREVCSLRGHAEEVLCARFSPDGKRVVSGSSDLTVKVWEVRSATAIHTFRGFKSGIATVSFLPDGKHILTKSRGNDVRLWNSEQSQEHLVLEADRSVLPVWCVAFGPDGKRIVSAGHERYVKLWDIETGAELWSVQGHPGFLNRVAFSPDGKRIVSGSSSRASLPPGRSPRGRRPRTQSSAIKVWDAATGQEVLALQGSPRAPRQLAFGPQGKRILVESVASLQTISQPFGVEPRAGSWCFSFAVALAPHAACPRQSAR